MPADLLLQLAARIDANPGEQGLPPIHAWHPEQVLDIGLQIDRQGRWFHQGAPFERTSLVRLFSTLLRRESDGDYYLVTPVEKVRVAVADVPFLIVSADANGQGPSQTLQLTTNVSDVLPLDADHPLRVDFTTTHEPRPYVRVRDQLEARILPQVFYQLVDLAELSDQALVLRSHGQDFLLGELDA